MDISDADFSYGFPYSSNFDNALPVGAEPPSTATPESHTMVKPLRPEPIKKDWLKGKCNWPDHLEKLLRDFMQTHKFLTYKKTDTNCNNLLNTVTGELRDCFDYKDWTDQNEADLKTKIKNKMHPIRRELEKDPITVVNTELDRLDSKQLVTIFKDLVQRIGVHEARSIVDACNAPAP